ncbi:helix-turn-helix domain-containing protein [Nocardiopsis sp. MG754419]|uniref:helix-turn-helix domain-containing protein n=1 Tax=Nocardiopsis sp. MG754419 TaxID=2259865 RepID=UPI001BABFBA1|nr:helix-turn-helix domain-containing protein [Nocardiopsis sp. MG754419]MBR8742577.1 hypothetical protein [Nocardiopsis sp. MG754419]
MTEGVLTTTQVAQAFGVHPRTVTAWAQAGKLPHFWTPGGQRRFHAHDVAPHLTWSRNHPAG